MDMQQIEVQYEALIDRATRLKVALLEQIGKLLESRNVALGVPLEGRVKTLASIAEKLERKSQTIETLQDLDDLVGVRAILLFGRDVSEAMKLIETTFEIVSSENTANRLGEAQFGYQSQHYVVRLPKGGSQYLAWATWAR
jgi:ppGpp synthetase/RelA/SpoT-type nucleotidyltranferase